LWRGADQWYYYTNTETYRLEVTNCDFKSEMEKIFDEVIEWTLRLRKQSSRSDSSGL